MYHISTLLVCTVDSKKTVCEMQTDRYLSGPTMVSLVPKYETLKPYHINIDFMLTVLPWCSVRVHVELH